MPAVSEIYAAFFHADCDLVTDNRDDAALVDAAIVAAISVGNPMLSRREKLLYHQIHPLKLAVDIATSLTSSWLLWRHELVLGLLIAWVPSVAVTLAMVRWMDFTPQRDSAFGGYVAHHMTRLAEAVRFGGQFIMWFGAWFHATWAITAGVVVIIVGWTYSLYYKGRRPPSTRLFESTDTKLGDEAELFRNLED